VADFLRQQLKPGADLDLVTAYFTVFAYDKLRIHLDNLGRIRLLFGEAAFIKDLGPEKTDSAAYVLRDDGLALAGGLNNATWPKLCQMMRDKVDVRSVTRTGFLTARCPTSAAAKSPLRSSAAPISPPAGSGSRRPITTSSSSDRLRRP